MLIQVCINKLTWCHKEESNKDLIFFLVLGHLPSIGADKANIEEMLKELEFRCTLYEQW